MKIPFNEKLNKLAELFPSPLYAVGGVVRNYLISKTLSDDVDLASSCSVEDIVDKVKQVGFIISAVYPRTGTLMFSDGEIKYEFTSFREEKYVGGEHTPYEVMQTNDIEKDARRRDFKCNAVYYDIKKGEIVDPLGGVKDIENKILDTVVEPSKVFCHDGLRLLRLARFYAQLDFKPTQKVIECAKRHADNIMQVSAERVYAELKQILVADTKYPFSNKQGHYIALKLLSDIRVLDRIMPELTLGRDMKQRADFHDYDVLEHSLRCVMYSPPEIRLFALLHDVGKPKSLMDTGKYYNHNLTGKKIAEEILLRLKAEKRTIEQAKKLVETHMLDMDCKMGKNKVKTFIVAHYGLLDHLLKLKQADHSACKDDLSEAPTVTKWKEIFSQMKRELVPFSVKELKISATDLIKMGLKGSQIGKALERALRICILEPSKNQKQTLIRLISKEHDLIK